MLACTALVGCTSDDVVENNNLNKNNSNAYMAVKLVMTESAGSRAASDGGFLVGTEAEKEIKGDKSIFLFYDANGKYVTSGQVISATAFTNGCEDTDEDHGEIEASANNDQKTTAYIVLSGTDEQIKNIDKVLTVVNYSQCESLKYKTLGQAQAAIATDDLSSETDPTTDDDANAGNAGFLMSTSVYYNANSELINYTAIDDEDFHETQESALAAGNPVVIHIERAAAKVELGFNPSYDLEEKGEGNDDAGDMTIDGE